MKTTFFEIPPIILWVGYAWIVIVFICMEVSKRKDAEKEAEFWRESASRWEKIAMDWRSVSKSFEQAADKNANTVERMLHEHQ